MKIRVSGETFVLWCPGCNDTHVINKTWDFDGNFEQPTFSPSILVTAGHYVPGFVAGSDCWCTFYADKPEDERTFSCYRCHSFIKNGEWQFLGDSSHDLAGKTVPMVDLPQHVVS